MTDFLLNLPPLILENLDNYELEYLGRMLSTYGGFPSLNQIWNLLDEQWVLHDCDPNVIDERVFKFYQHPVWLLNGLFIEQHPLSMKQRLGFADWIVNKNPKRIADFGGGFGTLARMIGSALPFVNIDVVEPHPHKASIALASTTSNVNYVSELSGRYDIIIATDVFEHVLNPISLAVETAQYLNLGGHYLIANCFLPVIKCHLPQNFYLLPAWDFILEKIGLTPLEIVEYGRSYARFNESFDIAEGAKINEIALKIWPFIQWLPKGRAKLGKILLNYFYHHN